MPGGPQEFLRDAVVDEDLLAVDTVTHDAGSTGMHRSSPAVCFCMRIASETDPSLICSSAQRWVRFGLSP